MLTLATLAQERDQSQISKSWDNATYASFMEKVKQALNHMHLTQQKIAFLV